MESSQFTDSHLPIESLELLDTHGATCNTFRVKLYGKLHFLKRLKPEFANDIRYQEAFRKEFETGYRLEHPNLVRYISLADNGILMEYIDGETLTQYLTNHPDYFKDKKNADKFLHQLLDVVGYLHSHQVLHLDLKPDNILLTRINNDVKLVDLGCCYTDTHPDTTGCTVGYAAPEQLSIVNSQLSIQTDIYAIGKVLELLPCANIYNKVIARCTADNPLDRFYSVEELRKALKPSHRKLFLLVLSVIVLLLCLLSYYHLQKRSARHVSEPRQMQETEIRTDSAPNDKKDSSPIIVKKSSSARSRGQENNKSEDFQESETELTETQRLEIRRYALRVIRPVYARMVVPVVNRINKGEYDGRIGYVRDSLSKVYVAANEEVRAVFRKDAIEKRYPHVSPLDVSEEEHYAIGDVMQYYDQLIMRHQYPSVKILPNPFED